MHERIDIVGSETLSDHWGKLSRVTIDYRRADGRVERLVRENYDRGNAAAIVLVDPARDTVLLVRQFRYPAMANGDAPFLLEVCAGMLDGDAPLDCARREALEESGHEPINIRHVCDVYMSPGSVQEKVALFVGEYGEATFRHGGGGLEAEGEEVEVVEVTLDDALAMIGRGDIIDGKSVILLQHLALERGDNARNR